jgi:hypothetical protein
MNIRPCSYFFSPTHKRTEGRAPMRGSEFTSKDATLQRDPAQTAAGLNVKLWDSVVVPGCGRDLPLSGTAEPTKI